MRADRYEVRAVWKAGAELISQGLEMFDTEPLRQRAPDLFGVYVIYGSHVQDHKTRAAAETHAGELNGQVGA